jgi:hypothetical protein
MTTLFGHTSPETAYLVADYPYGRTIRCRIRYWLESHPTKGFRFMAQTENPKTLTWNKPKASTYAKLAAVMFLDGEAHVTWNNITEYQSGENVVTFLERHPGADVSLLRPFAIAKCVFLERYAQGKAFFTINGVRTETTQKEIDRANAELAEWKRVVELCGAQDQPSQTGATT